MYFDEKNNYFDYDINSEVDNKKNTFNDMFNDLNFDVTNFNFNSYRKTPEVYNPLVGLNKGNMFANIYYPYEKNEYKIIVTGKRDETLLKIQALCFALTDLKLYLDIYPEDSEILNMFKNYVNEYKKQKEYYENNYGLISVLDVKGNKFNWINNPWPWEKGGNVNV